MVVVVAAVVGEGAWAEADVLAQSWVFDCPTRRASAALRASVDEDSVQQEKASQPKLSSSQPLATLTSFACD